jgi:hypothetical protein
MRAGRKEMLAGGVLMLLCTVLLLDAVVLLRGTASGGGWCVEGRDHCGCRAGCLDSKPLDISL